MLYLNYHKKGDEVMSTKKMLAAAITVAAVTSVTSVDASSVQDQTKAFEQLVEKGYAKGITATDFGLSHEIKRGDAAVILANILQLPLDATNSSFTDVNDKITPAVEALKDAGIINGKTKTTFAPNDQLTRGEFSIILTRAFELPLGDSASHFKDIGPKYAPYVNALFNHGITKGKSKFAFAPHANVTRGEFALFMERSEPYQNLSKPVEFTIMHSNDTHAHLDNIAKKVTAVKEVRESRKNTLLLDAGDVFSGTLYFHEFKGMADLEFMNMMKVDAMTFGNHEFDLGSSAEGHQALAEFVKAANFPLVSSNVDFSKDAHFEGLFSTKIKENAEGSHIYKGIVKEIEGEKVGIFGLTTAETVDISSPKDIQFSDYIEEAQTMVKEFEKMGINKIIAITHIGYDDNPAIDNDQELAKAVPEIDVIVGGHSHTTLKDPVQIGNTLIVQTGQYHENLGVLDVKFDRTGVVTEFNGELIKVADKAEDPEAATALMKYADKINAIKTEAIGAVALEELTNPRLTSSEVSVRRDETKLGNIITDGMLAKAREMDKEDEYTIMAFQNGGGIRSEIPKGEITVGQVINVLPFGNTLAVAKLTGAEIKQTFETSFRDYPRENGGFLHVAGAKVTFDPDQPVGERVVSIIYTNQEGKEVPLQLDQTYKIASNAFTIKGGDGYDILKKAYEEGRATDLGISDWENFREELVRLKEIDNQVEGRILQYTKTK